MAPDFTGPLIFPVDCSRNYTSRIICVPRSKCNKSRDHKDHSMQLHDVGYQIRQYKNSSILNMSTQICPEGYSLVYSKLSVMEDRNVFKKTQICLQLVRIHDFLSLKTVRQCSRQSQDRELMLKCANKKCRPSIWSWDWNSDIFRSDERDEVFQCAKQKCSQRSQNQDLLQECAEQKHKSQQSIDIFIKTCKMTDINSSVYGGIGDHWMQEAHVLNDYLLQVLPTTTLTFMSWHEAVAIENRTKCPSTLFCPHFPLHHRRLSHLGDLKSSCPFVLCAREPIMSPIVEIPVQFEPFTCADGSFIAVSLQCDGTPNCPNAEDEENCTHVCTNVKINCYAKCLFPSCQCSDFYYQCVDGGGMTFDKFCNGQQDCSSGEDEQGCVPAEKAKYSMSIITQDVDLATGFCLGRESSLPCVSETECYTLQELCHYDTKDGIIVYCADGTHLGGYCKMHVCNHLYKCHLSYCIPTRKVCNGVVDCLDADDESHCDNMACPGHLRCSHTVFCVPPHEICDGEVQCPFEEDEKFCMLCPFGCLCLGNIISCNNADALNLLASPAVLILNNSSFGVHQLEKTMPHFLENTFHLRLNHGKIHEILPDKISVLMRYNFLRWLQLNNMGIQILIKDFIRGPLIRWLDLSCNMIHSVQHQAFKQMKIIEVLNLHSNKLKILKKVFL